MSSYEVHYTYSQVVNIPSDNFTINVTVTAQNIGAGSVTDTIKTRATPSSPTQIDNAHWANQVQSAPGSKVQSHSVSNPRQS